MRKGLSAMADSEIKNIPTLKKMLADSKNMEQLVKVLSALGPILRVAGVDSKQIAANLPEIQELRRQAQEIAALPDRFNDLFAQRGWIMYDYMNLDVVKVAIAKAAAGDVDAAEQMLVEYYDEQTIRYQITWLAGTRAFRPRIPLARKALTDYAEGRYHACIPVLLLLLDGMVDDIGIHGFFAEGTDLSAWDSVAGHSKGLASLVRVLAKGRYTTTTEQITVPYRNGILHGHDLGYDNKLVAAKTWAVLFAAGDLVRKVERGERTEPPPKPQPTWRDTFKRMWDTEQTKVQTAAWRARLIQLGADIPVTGEPQDYGEGMPERILVAFLCGWRRRNYGQMAQCLRDATDQYQINKRAGDLRASFASKALHSFELLELRDEAPAMTVIKARLVYEQASNVVEVVRDFRVINEEADGYGTVRGKPGSRWILYTPYI
jgi:hypothetical protein